MKNVYTIAVLLLFLLYTLAPHTAHATALVDIKQFPQWFQDSMAREIAIKDTTTLKIEAFDVNATVVGKYTLVDDTDGTFYYSVDIGSASPVECYVFTEFDGPATSLHSILEFSLASIASINKKTLSGQSNFALNSGAVGNSPFLALDILYNLGSGDGTVSGILKSKVSQIGSSLQMCLHNEIGYQKSFSTVFTSFANAFLNTQKDDTFFDAIYQLSLNNINVGYVQESYTKDSDGDVAIVNSSSLLVPTDASLVTRTDALATSWSNPDGSIINASEYVIVNGEMQSDFSLYLIDDAWQVEGQRQGKSISAKLTHNEWLLSAFGNYIELELLRNSSSSAASFYMWAPSTNPSAAVKVELKQLSDNPNANVMIDMGSITMQLLADENGIFQQGVLNHSVLNQEVVQMKMTLIYVKGEPSLPAD